MAANLINKYIDKMPLWLILVLANLWPPFIGTGIRIKSISKNFRHMKVELKSRWYNKNYVGTQFGGSIYSMTDPFYMIMIMKNLGREYLVWDKSAQIDFIKPGRSSLFAEFELDKNDLINIRDEVEKSSKTLFTKSVEVKDREGQLIAKIEKVIYIRKKN